jgi:hypothetical protein
MGEYYFQIGHISGYPKTQAFLSYDGKRLGEVDISSSVLSFTIIY